MKEINLRCPYCHESGGLVFEPDLLHIRRSACGHCGREILVRGGIPDLAPHVPLVDPRLRPIQKLNNSEAFARLYESAVWRGFLTHFGSGMSMQREVQEVLRVAEAASPANVADLACGTGHYARAFSAAFPDARIYAIDVSMGMLGHGRKAAIERGCETIFFLRGDIGRIPLGDQTMDLVNCCGALHLFSNLQPIWREISRLLKPGGIFCGWTLIALQRWGERTFQELLLRRVEATFFQPRLLAQDLALEGLQAFRWVKRRGWLIFRAVKRRD